MSRKPGIYKDMPNEEYHLKDGFLSSSVLKTALKDPLAYYKQYVLMEEAPVRFQSAFDLGSYVHALVLEPHLVPQDFAMWDGPRKAGKEYESFKMRHGDKIILNKGQQDMGQMMYDNLCQTKIDLDDGKEIMAIDLFKGGEAEVSVFTKMLGMNLKARFDYIDVDKGVIIDVKTTSSDITTKEKAKEVVLGLDYDLSAALYLDIAEKQYGKKFSFDWCFMQKLSSFTKFYKASDATIEEGRRKYKEAIAKIKEWKKTGKYLSNKIEKL